MHVLCGTAREDRFVEVGAQDVVVLSGEQTPLRAAANLLLHVVQHVTVASGIAKLSCWPAHSMAVCFSSAISLTPRKHNHGTASEEAHEQESDGGFKVA